MIPLKLLIAWYVWFQTTSSLLSPAIFLALANIQNQRAKATLNALNWQAKNQYNLALAKSRAKLPAFGNFNSPAFGNSNLLPTFRNSNLLPGLKNPLIRTVREAFSDKDVTPVAEKVFLGGHDFGDVGKMDMLVPIDQDDEFSSVESPEAPHSAATGRSADLEAHLHIHKHLIPHHHHHHHKDIYYHGDINHHIHQSPSPAAFLPGPPQNFHSHVILDNRLPPHPPFSTAYAPPHLPLPTSHPPVQQHQSINLNVVQNQQMGSRNGAQTTQEVLGPQSHRADVDLVNQHGLSGHVSEHQSINLNVVQNQQMGSRNGGQTTHEVLGPQTHRADVDLVNQHGLSGHVSESVLRNGEDKDPMMPSEYETQGVYGKKPEEIKDKTVGIFHLVQTDLPPYQDPRTFDPTQPENRQDIAKFIKDEQQSMDRIVQSLNKNNYHYNAPRYSWQYPYATNEDEYDRDGGDARSRLSGGGERGTSRKDRIGSINTAELSQFPIALPEIEETLPDLLHGFDQPRSVEYRQEIIADYLETEQKNVQMAMEELQKAHQRNVEILLKNLNEDTSSQPDPMRERPLGNANSYPENDADLRNDEPPTEQLQNEPVTKSTTGISPLVGHIIQVPERRYSDDYYQRRARSIGGDATRSLEEALDLQRNLLKAMKRHTKHDGDLMMIEQIGKSIIDDIESRVEKNRVKRGAMKKDVLRLVTDPNEKFDMPKTLENLGAVARTAFEDKHAPIYHMRNMVGSTRDAVMATMKIPNQQFLVPTQYQITHTGRDINRDINLGDINPNFFATPSTSGRRNAQSGQTVDGVTNTFQKVGSVIRDTVESGKKALSHVGDAANHAKNAIQSTRHVVPKVIFKTIPSILRQSRKKTMIFTPRIFDFSQGDQQFQKTVGGHQENFVTAGDILDAVGVSEPNPSLKYEKITIEPRQNFLDQEEMTSSSSPSSQNLFDKIEVEDVDDIEHDPDLVGNTLDNLQQVQQSFGTNSLKDFILRMKKEVETLMKNAREKTLGGNNLSYDSLNRRRYNVAPSLSNRFQPPLVSQSTNREETVGYSFIPKDLTRPFMEQPGAKSTRRFATRRSSGVTDAPIVGAINPLVYERIFNERLGSGNPRDGSAGANGGGDPKGDRPVGTSMKIQGQFLKPFMGQATKKNKKDFFGLYNMNNDRKKLDSDVDQGYDYIELQSVENE